MKRLPIYNPTNGIPIPPMTVPNTTCQHIDFNDWLNQCPVQWVCHSNLTSDSSEDSVVYEFIFDRIDDD
jgi:hypothetical protein